MKTYSSLVPRTVALGALLAATCTATLLAGAGAAYWSKPAPSPAPAVTPAAPPPEAARTCTDSRPVALTERVPGLPNGRGPSLQVEVGTQRVCTSCATPTQVMKPSWPNGRGPLVAQSRPAVHLCTTGCLIAAK